MSNLARQEIYYGRRVELGQIVRGIDRVTVGRVRGLARRLFDDPPLALAAIGNLDRFRMAERELKL